MKTNREIAAKMEMMARGADTQDAEWLRAASNALVRLDAQPDADNSLFSVGFNRGTIPGKTLVTTVRLGIEVIGEELLKTKKFNVALCNHPSYANLVAYVEANPGPVKELPKSLKLGGGPGGATNE